MKTDTPEIFTVSSGLLLAVCVAGCSNPAEEAPAAEATHSAAPTSAVSETETVTATAHSESEAVPVEPVPAASQPVCDDALLQQTPGLEELTFGNSDCSSGFADVHKPQTDWVELVQWNGNGWEMVPYDGIWDGLGLAAPCWQPGKLRAMGVPAEIADHKPECGVY